jgi:DNA helicase-2/ATP-dependent DNA helicase PcrA
VFLIGVEEGVFPHIRALTEPDELEEERRLAYVGITRAQEKLFISHAWARTLFGSTQYNPPSRFISEIPEPLVNEIGSPMTFGRSSVRQRHDWEDRRHRRSPWDDDSSGSQAHREAVVEAALANRHSRAVEPSNAQDLGLRVGDDVLHPKYGEGVIIDISGQGDKAEATIRFRADAGTRTFVLAWSPLQKL